VQHVAGNFGVGSNVAEHGCHVRADHARAFTDTGHGDGHAVVHELTARAFRQGVRGHDASGGGRPVIHRQVVQRGLQGAFDFLNRQRLADDTGGVRQHLAGIHASQLGQLGAGTRSSDQTRLTGACVGIASVSQQVTDGAGNALLGQDHRSGTEGVEGENTGDGRTFGTAHHHHILAPRALDAGRRDTELKTGNRVQCGQRTKTNSHERAP